MTQKMTTFPRSIRSATDGDFEATIRYRHLTVVAFVKGWSGPCHLLIHALAELTPKYTGSVRVATLDVDKNPLVPARLGVKTVPSLMFFRNGMVVDHIEGSAPRAVIIQTIESHLSVRDTKRLGHITEGSRQ